MGRLELSALLLAASMAVQAQELDRDAGYTLYRNSGAFGLRIHFASFDAAERDDFNRLNCDMAARLLNANVRELSGDIGAGFWCERGPFREDGRIPVSFDAEFPARAG